MSREAQQEKYYWKNIYQVVIGRQQRLGNESNLNCNIFMAIQNKTLIIGKYSSHRNIKH